MAALWRFISLADLIPALDPLDPNSLVSQANKSLDELDNRITAFSGGVTRFATEIAKLSGDVSILISAVQEFNVAFAETAISVLCIFPPGLPVGKAAYAGAVAAALNLGTAPVITGATVVGSISMIATGPTPQHVITALQRCVAALQGVADLI